MLSLVIATLFLINVALFLRIALISHIFDLHNCDYFSFVMLYLLIATSFLKTATCLSFVYKFKSYCNLSFHNCDFISHIYNFISYNCKIWYQWWLFLKLWYPVIAAISHNCKFISHICNFHNCDCFSYNYDIIFCHCNFIYHNCKLIKFFLTQHHL